MYMPTLNSKPNRKKLFILNFLIESIDAFGYLHNFLHKIKS